MQIFEISPGLFVWSLITFLILLGLLYKFAFNPLMRMQKARQDSIHQAINDAESLRNEAQELLVNYKQQLTEAREEASTIVERARKAGESTKTELLEEARVQAEATLAKARQQIERDTNQALQRIREEVADLTVAATERVAGKSLTGEDQLRLIQEAINEIDLSKVSEN
ncbi:MAG: F0F1 ATP synthase subunit B [Actinobacteria bacterium]|nr:F0F1 ATP synthase subunit B [Actinomycetota bacterium]